MNDREKEQMREALLNAKIDRVLLDRFVDDFAAESLCGESCRHGCSKCCASGSANRAAAYTEQVD